MGVRTGMKGWALVLFLVFSIKGFAQQQPELDWPQTYLEKLGNWDASQPKMMVKLDVINLVRVFEPKAVRGLWYLSFEHRLGVKWSLNSELGGGYRFSWQKNLTSLSPLPEGLSIALSARRYTNLKDRILAGDNPEALNGGYVAVMVATGIFPVAGSGSTNQVSLWYPQFVAVAPHFGIQRAIFNGGYIDFGVGFKAFYGHDDPFQLPMAFTADKPARFRLLPMSNLRVGLSK